MASEQQDEDYVRRREVVLRRALVSGDRLVASLAVILQGHRPEAAPPEMVKLVCGAPGAVMQGRFQQ